MAAKKPALVVLQTYYERGQDSCKESPVQARGGRREQDREVPCLVARPTAPPPPPMPPDSSSISSLNNSSPPSCPTPDYDTSSLVSEASYTKPKHTNGTIASSEVTPLNSSINKLTNNVLRPTTNSFPLQVNDLSKNTKVHPTELNTKKFEENVNKLSAKISSEDRPSQLNKSKNVCDTDRVEMISIESFTLNNPSSPKPKPPPTYFGSNATELSAKKPKSVAVTIGEYQTGVDRRRPARFGFLTNPNSEEKMAIGEGGKQIGSLLQTELAQTLSRSNLKNQTDSQNYCD